MPQSPRNSPRAEHLARERQRVEASPTLATQYGRLASLTVEFGNYDSSGLHRVSQVKYKVNLESAKSVFCFSCHSMECVGGNFDLSTALAQAIADRRKEVTGESRCPGWRSRADMGAVHCQNLLRYRFVLKYKT